MRKFAGLLAAFALLFSPLASATDLISTPATTTLSYTQGETISVSVDTPALTLTTTQQTINVTTNWNLASSRLQVVTAAYFSSSSALTAGSNVIPTSAILGQGLNAEEPCNSMLTIFAESYPNGCDEVLQKTSLTGAYSGTSTNAFKIRLSPSAVVPAGVYSGTLNFVAIAE